MLPNVARREVADRCLAKFHYGGNEVRKGGAKEEMEGEEDGGVTFYRTSHGEVKVLAGTFQFGNV